MKEYYVTTCDNIELYCVEDEPLENAKATVIILHGTCEHTGRYKRVAEALVQDGYRALRYDMRGFGRSGGKRAWVATWRDYIDDLALVVNHVKETYPDQKIVILGHSMGSMVAFNYSVLHPGGAQAYVVSGLSTRSDLLGFSFDEDEIDEDGYVANELDGGACALPQDQQPYYCIDPYVERKISVEYFYQVHEGVTFTAEHIQEFSAPIFIGHGQNDTIVVDNNALVCYAHISSDIKTLRIYDSIEHDIFRSKRKNSIFRDVTEFLDENLPKL